MIKPKQEVLSISLRDEYSFDNFYSGANSPVVHGVRRWTNKEGNWFIYLCGQPGSGRSHLLQAACRERETHYQKAIYLPFSELVCLSPSMLDGLEEVGFICIDDVDAIAGNRAWEEALFHLYNRLLDSGGR
ncbi:MAG: hypothetical protein KUG76_01990 [Gammaproteobacteria bacterium]|nr:hypothetical protein [Gammaproteobacteria bacterium]